MEFLVLFDEVTRDIQGYQTYPLESLAPNVIVNENITESEINNFLKDKQISIDGLSLEPASQAVMEHRRLLYVQEQIGLITFEVQNVMDAEARSLGYDSLASAVTYAEEDIDLVFQAEGKAFRKWRSLCWRYCYDVLESWNNGEITEDPTPESIVLGLPALDL